MSKAPIVEFIRNFKPAERPGDECLFKNLEPTYEPKVAADLLNAMVSSHFATVLPMIESSPSMAQAEHLLGSWVVNGSIRRYHFCPFSVNHVMRPETVNAISFAEVRQIFSIAALGWTNDAFADYGMSIPFNAWLFANASTCGGAFDYDAFKVYYPHTTKLLPEIQGVFEGVLKTARSFGQVLIPFELDVEKSLKDGLMVRMQDGKIDFIADTRASDRFVNLSAAEVEILTSDTFVRTIDILGNAVLEMFASMTRDDHIALHDHSNERVDIARSIFQTFFGGYRLAQDLIACGFVKSKYLCSGREEGPIWSVAVQELTRKSCYLDALLPSGHPLVAAAQEVADAIRAQE